MALFDASTASAPIIMADGLAGSDFYFWLGAGNGSFPSPTVTTGTQFTLVNHPIGSSATIRGTGLTYTTTLQGTELVSELTGGTITSITVTDSVGDQLYRLSGVNVAVVAGADLTLDLFFGGADTLRGGAGNDLLDGRAGADSIVASFGDDTLIGGTGTDTLNGGTGFDFASYAGQAQAITVSLAAAGSSTLSSASGNDTLSAIEGIYGSTGNDSVAGTGATGIDNRFFGNDGNDSLDGGAGNDTIGGGAGDDALAGGAGIDTVTYADAAILRVAFNAGSGAVTATEVGGAQAETATGFENAIGSTGNDTLIGAGGSNIFDGQLGMDTLNGGLGADTLRGGDGDNAVDTLIGQGGADWFVIEWSTTAAAFDTVTEAAGPTDRDTVELRYSTSTALAPAGYGYTLGANLENLIIDTGNQYYYGSLFAGVGNTLNNQITARSGTYYYYQGFRLYGLEGNDTLNGSNGNDTLNGGTGADSMVGGQGNDLFLVDAAGDTVVEAVNGGLDTVNVAIDAYTLGGNFENLRLENLAPVLTATGNAGANRMIGNEGDNVLNGLGGLDNLSGGAGADSLYGGDQDDVLTGGLGNDLLDGGSGNDTASFALAGVEITADLDLVAAQATGLGSDTLVGIEHLTGGTQADELSGSAGSNNLFGLGGDDRLVGRDGFDNLQGGDGSDTLVGGAGYDYYYGGAGADRFVLDAKETLTYYYDFLLDFESGTDRVQVSMNAFDVGDGDNAMEGAVTRSAPGGFGVNAELVAFTQDLGYYTTYASSAAATIGSANAAYAAGDVRLFLVQGVTGSTTASALWLFTSSGADAVVDVSELQLVATLSGPSAAVTGDFLFGA
ncbi:MAG TPA: calcium-binding protein [Methylibium sp.]|nr:calcium-binding protein [Methylibium sp.]